jgi:hypothetical protein
MVIAHSTAPSASSGTPAAQKYDIMRKEANSSVSCWTTGTLAPDRLFLDIANPKNNTTERNGTK